MLIALCFHFFYREYRDHVKDLTCISQDLCRVVIVDNNPFSFLLQPLNGIPCVPFSAGQPQDDQVTLIPSYLQNFKTSTHHSLDSSLYFFQLLEVLLPLIKQLSVQDDVRPILYDKFHMPEWFQKHGIPSSGWKL